MPFVTSYEDAAGMRCIDVIERDDRTFVLKECRRDPEAGGRWSVVADYSQMVYDTRDNAIDAARAAFPWLAEAWRHRD